LNRRAPFAPIGSERPGAQGESKARSGTGATHSPKGEHGEEPPFDAAEHRGIVAFIRRTIATRFTNKSIEKVRKKPYFAI
jgi:hypothetical protein